MDYKRLKFEECREDVYNIRRKVFIEEQNCPEHMEWDENEEKDSLYFVAFRGTLAVGCLRLRKIENDVFKMERVAVLKEFRRRGIASELIREAMLYTQTEAPNTSIYAYAQVSALQAYVSLGFTVLSKVWIEDGTFIPHQTIFWGTPVSIEVFLKHIAEKTEATYEEYDARHPSIVPKIEAYKQRLENLDQWSICSLHLHLDDRIVSKILRKRFVKLCIHANEFLDGKQETKEKVTEESRYLLRLADSKLNTGHFNEVDENWRRLYAAICFLQSFLMFKQENYEASCFKNECSKKSPFPHFLSLHFLFFENNLFLFQDAVKIADKGLCMGRIEENLVPLRQLALIIHEHLPGMSSEDTIHPSFCFNSKNNSSLLKPLPNSIPIEECDDDEETSLEKLISAVNKEIPLLIRNHSSNMPAVQKWTFPFFLQQLHSRTFPVEIGTKYSDEDWSQKMMTFRSFIQNSENQQLYLAQHRLFDQVPHLRKDVIIPDICFSESTSTENVDMNMWIGPSDTVSPLHTDPRKNMFVQIHGTKLFRMVSPDDSESVYPFDGILSNTSQIDVEHPDLESFPDFSKVRVLDRYCKCRRCSVYSGKVVAFGRSTTLHFLFHLG
ncbi:hypothetical protein CAEBREN_26263 [Caenorhabditis brenneri]|uniref:Glucosamine-phosphate N-acetyltransferase n=1 Tax=Caenorhabditis brenneri TaxID=135651 RepID=G0N8J5_CAEBE|nr:hypothetical protein CAEBREN_26263 [Caenorhabditis brenneri]